MKRKNHTVSDVNTVMEIKTPLQSGVKVSTKQIRPRREVLFKVMALLLIFCVTLGIFCRASCAAPELTTEDIQNFTKVSCRMEDRFGLPIYEEGEVTDYSVFGNLVGYESQIHNSLVYAYADLLKPAGVDPITGYRTLERQPRVLKTTLLSAETQQELLEMFGDKAGCCFSYNYETGEVYTALSTPIFDPHIANPDYNNRSIKGEYAPGSIMKIVTAALAVDQGLDVENLRYTCERIYTLSNGDEIECMGYHGTIGFSTAIGVSCNCYFAQLIQDLKLEPALETLEKMGFSVNESEKKTEKIGLLNKSDCMVTMTNTASFKNVWSLIGQGNTRINAIDMAMIAAAVANGGEVASPYIVSSIENPNQKNEKKQQVYLGQSQPVTLLSGKTADTTAGYWKEGVDRYYYKNKKMDPRITYAKTGTAQRENDNKKVKNSLLIGVMESSKTAFCIVLEENEDSIRAVQIANKLAELLPN